MPNGTGGFEIHRPTEAPTIQIGFATPYGSATQARFAVAGTRNGTVSTVTSEPFVIAAPTVSLLSPSGGEVFSLGDTITVKWASTGLSPKHNSIIIGFYTDSGATEVSGTGRVAAVASGTVSFKVVSEGTTGSVARLATIGTTSTTNTFYTGSHFRLRLTCLSNPGNVALVTPATSGDFAITATVPLTGRLLNLSTRGFVGTGLNVLAGGFFLVTGPKNILIRAIGPGLTQFGVPGVLDDPRVDLYQGATLVASNDNWGSTGNTAAIIAAATSVGAFALPNGSKDSVLLMLALPAGSYTPVVSGVDGGTGIGLVEVYELP